MSEEKKTQPRAQIFRYFRIESRNNNAINFRINVMATKISLNESKSNDKKICVWNYLRNYPYLIEANWFSVEFGSNPG